MTDIQARVILAYAAHDMCCYRAHDDVHLSKNGMNYYLDRIQKDTGLNPRCFYDLVKLVEMANDVRREENG